MKERKASFLFSLCFFLLILKFFALQAETPKKEEELERGKVIPHLECLREKGKSYSLYLPSPYSFEREWPVIYAFDPWGRGVVPVELFREAAEKYGYIVIGSNDSRADSWKLNFQSLKSIWIDTNLRFRIDARRIYTAGFSWGVGVSTGFSYMLRRPVAGIIACSGGLPEWLEIKNLGSEAFYGIIAPKDISSAELSELDEQLGSLGVSHRLKMIEGEPRWPPPQVLTEAVEWLEIQAMKRGKIKVDEDFLNSQIQKLREKARLKEDSKDVPSAVKMVEAMISDFEGLIDVSYLKEELEGLKKSPLYQSYLGKEKILKKNEKGFLVGWEGKWKRLIEVFENPLERRKAVMALGVDGLLRETKTKKDFLEVSFASRKLGRIFKDSFREASGALQRNEPQRALVFLRIAAAASLEEPLVLYKLACASALTGDKKGFLRTLRRAVEKGFQDAEIIENEEAFTSFREEPEFKMILQKIKDG